MYRKEKDAALEWTLALVLNFHQLLRLQALLLALPQKRRLGLETYRSHNRGLPVKLFKGQRVSFVVSITQIVLRCDMVKSDESSDLSMRNLPNHHP